MAGLVEAIAADRGTTRVAQVAEQAGLTVRSLQRLFAEYVGAGPKWVIQRCRLQDAAARVAAQDDDLDWAALAAELGFADQAHLTRAFTATIGVPPPPTPGRRDRADSDRAVTRRVGCTSNTRSVGYPPYGAGRYPQDFPGAVDCRWRSLMSPTTR